MGQNDERGESTLFSVEKPRFEVCDMAVIHELAGALDHAMAQRQLDILLENLVECDAVLIL